MNNNLKFCEHDQLPGICMKCKINKFPTASASHRGRGLSSSPIISNSMAFSNASFMSQSNSTTSLETTNPFSALSRYQQLNSFIPSQSRSYHTSTSLSSNPVLDSIVNE
jgi:hypothetical protein